MFPGAICNENLEYIAVVDDILYNGRLSKSYCIVDYLGEGSYCQVLLVSNLKQTKYYAAKILRADPAIVTQVGQNERKIIIGLNKLESSVKKEEGNYPSMKTKGHSKIVKLKDYFDVVQYTSSSSVPEIRHTVLVFEKLEMSLLNLMESVGNQGMSVWMIQKFALYLVEALLLLKLKRVTHCDIKPENMMLEK